MQTPLLLVLLYGCGEKIIPFFTTAAFYIFNIIYFILSHFHLSSSPYARQSQLVLTFLVGYD